MTGHLSVAEQLDPDYFPQFKGINLNQYKTTIIQNFRSMIDFFSQIY